MIKVGSSNININFFLKRESMQYFPTLNLVLNFYKILLKQQFQLSSLYWRRQKYHDVGKVSQEVIFQQERCHHDYLTDKIKWLHSFLQRANTGMVYWKMICRKAEVMLQNIPVFIILQSHFLPQLGLGHRKVCSTLTVFSISYKSFIYSAHKGNLCHRLPSNASQSLITSGFWWH